MTKRILVSAISIAALFVCIWVNAMQAQAPQAPAQKPAAAPAAGTQTPAPHAPPS